MGLADTTPASTRHLRQREPRAQLLERAVDAVENQGGSVEVIGVSGSGRSHFLRALEDHCTAQGLTTLALSGIASLRARPLGALAALVPPTGGGAPMLDLHATVHELSERLPLSRSVVLVDDRDHLDELTWGVLCALNVSRHVPIVYSRRAGYPEERLHHHDSVGLRGAHTVELADLRYDEFVSILTARFNRTVEPRVLSQIYAQTGGLPGLAIAVADAALRERHSFLNDDHAASSHIWSPALAYPLEALLHTLTVAERDSLTAIALRGEVDIDNASAYASDDVLDRLEAHTLLHLQQTPQTIIVSVHPPLLAEHLRNESSLARRRRLLGTPGSADVPPPVHLNLDATHITDPTRFVYMVQQQQQHRIQDAHAAWISAPSARTAVDYIRAIRGHTSADNARIRDVLDAPECAQGTDADHAHIILESAYTLAFDHTDPAEAVDALKRGAMSVGEYAPFLLARASEMEIDFLLPRSALRVVDADLADHPLDVQVAVHRALAYAALVDGQVETAHAHTTAAAALTPHDDVGVTLLQLLTGIAAGDTEEVAAQASDHFAAARTALDATAMKLFATISAVCALIEGRHSHLDPLIDEIAPFEGGISTPPAALLASSLDVVTSILTSRHGHRDTLEHNHRDADVDPLAGMPLPGMQMFWAQAQTAVSAGNTAIAAQLTLSAADGLWDQGARLAAAFAYNVALELDPYTDRFEQIAARVTAVNAGLIQTTFAFVKCLVERTPEPLVDLAGQFESEKRYSLALAAYSRATDMLTSMGRLDDAATARSRLDSLERRTLPLRVDIDRFISTRVELTPREMQIARLAATGMSNKQIAETLVLSTRTVESHLYRVMRKTGIERRSQLKDRLESSQTSPAPTSGTSAE